jgi:hypothetical protein
MNTENFRKIVEALEKLPQEVKNREVDIISVKEPLAENISDFTGLISLAGRKIPGMLELYNPELEYSCSRWALVLDIFLDCNFSKWASRHPSIWGNYVGYGVYTSTYAFGKKETLINNDIILHMRKAYNRWIGRITVDGEEV